MFGDIMAVVSWIGIAVFMVSVADSLSKIARAMNRDGVASEEPVGSRS